MPTIDPIRLSRWTARRFCRRVPAAARFFDDLVSECLMVHATHPGKASTTYYVKAGHRRCAQFYARQICAELVQRPGHRLHSCRSRPEDRLEKQEEYQGCLAYVLEHLGPQDWAVLKLFTEGGSLEQISSRCPWLSSADSVGHAVNRIIRTLRERSGLPVPRATEEVRAYQRRYYQAHRQERIDAATRSRHQRREGAATKQFLREQIHRTLIDLGYRCHSQAASGASSYYVHWQDGFRVRLSDHAPRSTDTMRLVAEGRMALVDVRTEASAEEALARVERLHQEFLQSQSQESKQ